MRSGLTLAAFLLVMPGHARADAIAVLEFEFRNADLTFGFVNPDLAGWDLDAMWLLGEPLELPSWARSHWRVPPAR